MITKADSSLRRNLAILYECQRNKTRQQDPEKFKLTINSEKSMCSSYLLPVLHHLTCKPSLYCKSSFGTINCHSKLNVNTLHQKDQQWEKKIPKKKGGGKKNKRKPSNAKYEIVQVLRAATSYNKTLENRNISKSPSQDFT
jgi:hypothetical protein